MTAKKVPVIKKESPDVYFCINVYEGYFETGSSVQEAHEAMTGRGCGDDVSHLEFYRAKKIKVSIEYVVKEEV